MRVGGSSELDFDFDPVYSASTAILSSRRRSRRRSCDFWGWMRPRPVSHSLFCRSYRMPWLLLRLLSIRGSAKIRNLGNKLQ